ncbi:hypothetical protein EW145_g5815 [Phellinidium pouzarii]|uniref:Uncharacterized protein n=1 Tax=Phellinidium pouzarii TaxID=167371 RepID=A0A4S4KYU2_9AGAM|nr:hypothetical protein EW145_g5815 [Phellinidium pouzarii]
MLYFDIRLPPTLRRKLIAMAFRATLARSARFSIRLAQGLFDAKPEAEEFVRKTVFQKVEKDILLANLDDAQKVEAYIASGPHRGGAPGSKSQDFNFHSTVIVSMMNNEGKYIHWNTIHVTHDEEEYKKTSMAFRATLARQARLSIRLARGLFDAKPESEEFICKDVGYDITTRVLPSDLDDDQKVEAYVASVEKTKRLNKEYEALTKQAAKYLEENATESK